MEWKVYVIHLDLEGKSQNRYMEYDVLLFRTIDTIEETYTK